MLSHTLEGKDSYRLKKKGRRGDDRKRYFSFAKNSSYIVELRKLFSASTSSLPSSLVL